MLMLSENALIINHMRLNTIRIPLALVIGISSKPSVK
jgi:hypothetical protein